jgi:hypothetical protein
MNKSKRKKRKLNWIPEKYQSIQEKKHPLKMTIAEKQRRIYLHKSLQGCTDLYDDEQLVRFRELFALNAKQKYEEDLDPYFQCAWILNSQDSFMKTKYDQIVNTGG